MFHCGAFVLGDSIRGPASAAIQVVEQLTITLMHITRHDNFDSLAADQSTWNELSQGVPFRAWEWLERWWRYYGCGDDGRPLAGHELMLLAVRDEQHQLVGVAPWYRQT